MKISFLSVVYTEYFSLALRGHEDLNAWATSLFCEMSCIYSLYIHLRQKKESYHVSSFIILKIGPISLSPNSSAWFTRASLTVLYPTRTTVFLGPKNTWICSRRFWRAGEHRERHLQTNQKMLGCYHYLNVFKSSSHLKKGVKGSCKVKGQQVPHQRQRFWSRWLFPFFQRFGSRRKKIQNQKQQQRAPQLMHSHICSSCVREGPCVILNKIYKTIHENKGLLCVAQACMWLSGESLILLSLLKRQERYSILCHKSKSSGLTQSLHQYYCSYMIKTCLLVYICTTYSCIYFSNNAQRIQVGLNCDPWRYYDLQQIKLQTSKSQQNQTHTL